MLRAATRRIHDSASARPPRKKTERRIAVADEDLAVGAISIPPCSDGMAHAANPSSSLPIGLSPCHDSITRAFANRADEATGISCPLHAALSPSRYSSDESHRAVMRATGRTSGDPSYRTMPVFIRILKGSYI